MSGDGSEEARVLLRSGSEFRHACKRFDSGRPLEETEVALLLETVRLAPTSFGMEPWRLVEIADPALRCRLLPHCPGAAGQLPTADRFYAFTALRGSELDPRGEYFERHLTEVKGLPPARRQALVERFERFAADEFRLDTPERLGEWAQRQAYLALGVLLLAAGVLGIDSCPIEGFDREAVEALLEGRGGFERRRESVAVLVALGRRAQEAPPRTRRPPEAVFGRA